MKDDPLQITQYLIAQHGSLKAALDAAITGTVEAQHKKDLYALSIWRDVKRLLREKVKSELSTKAS